MEYRNPVGWTEELLAFLALVDVEVIVIKGS